MKCLKFSVTLWLQYIFVLLQSVRISFHAVNLLTHQGQNPAIDFFVVIVFVVV